MGINEYIQIGSKIKKLRKEKNIPQKKMAELLGLAHSTYSNYENDLREPNLDILKQVCEILGVGLDELMGNKYPVGVNILWARKKAKLTVEEFCEKTGISKNRYLSIISSSGTKQEFEKASEITGVSYKELTKPMGFVEFYVFDHEFDYEKYIDAFGLVDGMSMPRPESKFSELFNHFYKLNAQGQEKAIEQVELLTKVPDYKK